MNHPSANSHEPGLAVDALAAAYVYDLPTGPLSEWPDWLNSCPQDTPELSTLAYTPAPAASVAAPWHSAAQQDCDAGSPKANSGAFAGASSLDQGFSYLVFEAVQYPANRDAFSTVCYSGGAVSSPDL